MMCPHWRSATAALLLLASTASAQSLGDVARKEAARRAETTAPSKVYTNESLTPDFTEPEPTPAAEPAAPLDTAEEEPPAAAQNVAADPDEAAKWGVTPLDQQEPAPADDLDESFWRDRAALIRARLASQSTQVQQLRNQLSTFPSDARGPERTRVDEALRRAETNLEHLQAEWQRFEGQARDRNVPLAWIQ